MPAALIASPVIGPVRNCATSSFGIEGRPATTRSSFLVRLGIRRLLGVGYAPHTETRTGSERIGKRTVAVSLGITYCVVTVAWGFALVKMVAWLSTGMPPLAHSIGEQAKVVISGRSVLASSPAAVHPQPTDCDP